MIQLDKRTDRVLPNGWCLLPPTKSCEKGNACLPCGHFATDATHQDELSDQHRRTLKLIEVRTGQHAARHGAPMGEDNIWLAGRRREIASLDAILHRLEQQPDGESTAVRGAGAPSIPASRENGDGPPGCGRMNGTGRERQAAALRANAAAKSQRTRQDADKAIRELRKAGLPVTFTTVAKRANFSELIDDRPSQ